MKTIKGTKTEINLQNAFSGESQARNKYTYFASVAKKEGYNQIADIFLETANNEKEHAKLWFKALNDGKMANTIENLCVAAAGEHYEWSEMYKDMAKTAREEEFNEIAAQLEGVGEIEKAHEKRYLDLLEKVKSDTIFSKNEEIKWYCTNCGHEHIGKVAPETCPICKHKKGYFQIKPNNY
jgi:rubrerythrin